MKLTKAQIVALTHMDRLDKAWSSYRMGLGLNTLEALERKGYVQSSGRGRVGAFYSPSTIVEWAITPAGRAALKEVKE